MKKKPMQKVVVSVSFTGTVEVEVPAGVPEGRRESLARRIALARLLATTDNPDAPEENACEEYQVEFGLDDATAGRNWDRCRMKSVSGTWSSPQATDDAAVGRLTDKAEAAGLQPEDLDELVHELASSIASDINNSGLDGQVAYLVKEMGAQQVEKQIDGLIEERKEGED